MKKYTFGIMIVILLQVTGFVFGAIPHAEREALIALYNSTNGESWITNSGWKTPPLDTDGFAMPGTEESWVGVTVTADHVTHLDMNHNNLRGTIPAQLGALTEITYLLLGYNQLTGSIPPQLANITQLQVLLLSSNELSGSIPPELGNLPNINRLYLENNRLSGTIPKELCNLPNLDHLWLSYNQLTGSIPKELSNLKKLTYLWLDSNQLTGTIPPELGNISNLYSLFLFQNQLSGSIPAELGNLSSLNILLLSRNQLSGNIPKELGNLSALQSLAISENLLSGSIPSELGNCRKMQSLFINNNQLEGNVPSSFTNYTLMTYLNISYNCITPENAAVESWLNIHDPGWETTQCLEKVAPFGEFATPIDGAIVSGSIAVTGWALDDYGMANVKIYYEQDHSLVFIGDAIFVEGARPDVAIAYPEYPENTRAGWGYMLLTHFLPNGGNGTYVLHAIATDKYNKTTVLGTKTITISNATAVKPFGAIDTPTQGGIASGYNYVNWGWVLTPQPNKIPTSGATINVFIDGVKVGHPTYNIYRADIATLFPFYANSNGAIGYFTWNTMPYSYGLHTIQWSATDNAGNIDGIGSRYFMVQNMWGDSTQRINTPLTSLNKKADAIPELALNDFAALQEENTSSHLVIKELERVEIKVCDNPVNLQGYLIGPDKLGRLPIGSTLNSSGTFYWSPGPGFLGRYALVFVWTDPNGLCYKKYVEIEIKPKFDSQ